MKLYLLQLVLIFILFSCQERAKNESPVVATNSWTAAYARAAGAKNIVTLAPLEMTHPSEYELRAVDVPIVMHAKLIVFAGYETMVNRLQSSMELKPEQLLKIETDYDMITLERSVMVIAKQLGTEKTALQNLDSIRHLLQEGRAQFDKSGLNATPVLVNFFQQSIVKEMGFTIAGVFGPGSLEAADIDEMAKINSGMIIDNEHNPVGKPIHLAKPGLEYRQLLNFPGLHHTISLQEVIKYNILQLSNLTVNNVQ
jgi:hypothetical protein